MNSVTRLAVLALLALSCGCTYYRKDHSFPAIQHDRDVLKRLGYTGPRAGVLWIGNDKCFTNDDTVPYPQPDLKCE